MSWSYLAFSLIGAAFSLHAFFPVRHRRVLWLGFFAAWLTSELALHHVAWQLLVALGFIALGALSEPAGWVALALNIASWTGLVALHMVSRHARVTVGRSLRGHDLHVRDDAPHYPRSHLVWPLAAWQRKDIEVTRDVPFAHVDGVPLCVDIYRRRGDSHGPRPAVIQVHGGAWKIGHKRYQGIPLLTHLAAHGWVGFNVDYRLSPAATFPDHLIDLKRAVAWIRANAEQLGVRSDFIAVTGGSAGGHLAALLALTPEDASYQPGFEDADTSVQAAATFYGVYDFTNRLGTKPPGFRDFLENVVMKRRYEDEPAAYSEASPLDRIHPWAPPFFVVHGESDTITPVQDARVFVERLRAATSAPVVYAEIAGAQHAFDTFPSVRSVPVMEATEQFLHAMWTAHRLGARPAMTERVTARAITDCRISV